MAKYFIKSILPVVLVAPIYAAMAQVRINEVMVKPGPNSLNALYQSMKYCSADTAGSEWVELYNPSPCDTADISCYILGSKTTSTNGASFAFPSGIKIPPLGFLVAGGPRDPGVDLIINDYCSTSNVCGSDRWFLENTDGWVALYTPVGGVSDAVFWTFNAADSASIGTGAEFNYNPCTPPACAGAGTLKKANQMVAGEIRYAGEAPSMGLTIYRTSDGSGMWQTGGSPTVGNCNGPCAVPTNLYTTISVANSSCGSNDGTATVTIDSGGTPPFSYLWNTIPAQTTSTATGLSAGLYIITVTDGAGCKIIDSATITQPVPFTLSVSTQSAACGNNDGLAWVTIAGGTTPFTYLWSNTQSNDTAFSLAQGSYTITVTDSTGCTSSDTALVNNTGGGVVTASIVSNVTCYGFCNGQASVSMSGGTPPFTYSWSSGGSTATDTGLCAVSYTVTVSDFVGCISIDSVTITQPTVLSVSETHIDVLCNSTNTGSINITVSGGTGTYTYNWNDLVTTEDRPNITAGIYAVTVTDANNCTATASVIVTEPAALNLSTSSTDATCGSSDGSATVTVTGGTTPYSYLWSNSSTQSTATGLVAGSYMVTVTDSNICIITTTAIVNNIGAATITITNIIMVSCYSDSSGSATATATGGTTPYTYQWDDPAATTAATVANLPAGSYTITVTDSTGCQSIKSVTITQPTAITVSLTSANTCSGLCDGIANSTVNGGTQPYTYFWSDGSTTQSISGLCAGAYSFTVTDANNCTATGNAAIISLAFNVTAGPDTAINYGESLTLYASPAGAASYSWIPTSSLVNSTSQNPVATPLETTEYIVVVTSTNGCTGRDTVKITVIREENILFIPNAFTPGAGKNDVFYIRGANIREVRFYIYNRWGELVYQYEGTDILSNGWDGTYRGEKCNPAVFVYYGQIIYNDDTTEDVKGNVTLVR